MHRLQDTGRNQRTASRKIRPTGIRKQKSLPLRRDFFVLSEKSGGATQSRTGLNGFAIHCITDLLSRRLAICILAKIMGKPAGFPKLFGAGKETRTLDLYLGKVSLYQLSYSRKKRSPHYKDIELCVKKNCTEFLFCSIFVRVCIMRRSSIFELAFQISTIGPSGEIGRHNGLKIRRLEKAVPVQFRSRAPQHQ